MASNTSHHQIKNPKKSGRFFLNPHPSVRHRQPHNKIQVNPITNLADEKPAEYPSSVPAAIESMNMIEAGNHHGVGNEGKGDEISGHQSIEKAIEESLAMKIKRIPVAKISGSESEVVARERTDDSIRNLENGKTTQLRETLNSNKAGADSMAVEEDFKVENYQLNDLQRGRGEIEINTRQGNHVDCVGETSDGADSNMVQISQKSPKCRTLRDPMILQDNGAVGNNQAMNICSDASPGTAYQPSTEEATPKVAEKLNLEKQDTELEAYILDKLSLLEPSFRTLFEPSVAGTNSTGSSDNKTGQEPGKSKRKKKIRDVVANVTNSSSAKKQQQSPDLEDILYETDVKGILKMRWEEDRKKSQVKNQRTRSRWPRSCFCCPRSNSTGKNMEWEFQLEEYSSAW